MKTSHWIAYFKYSERISVFALKVIKPVETIIGWSFSGIEAVAFKYVLTVDKITSSFLTILLALDGAFLNFKCCNCSIPFSYVTEPIST